MSYTPTAREQQMLKALATGKSHAQIALLTHQSVSSIGNALSRMYRRLGARNAPHAVAIGFRRGLLP